MEPKPSSHLLDIELEQNRQRVYRVLSCICKESRLTPALVEDGLMAAHTLKALAAVKGRAHLEQFAAQLEQVFLAARSVEGKAGVPVPSVHSFKRILREFESASRIEAQYAEADETGHRSAQLDDLVDRLHEMKQRERRLRFQRHQRRMPQQSASLEMVFQAFVPWLYQTARTQEKNLMVAIEMPKPIAIDNEQMAPLQAALVHLLRNALFHGVEAPFERLLNEKTQTALIRLSAEVVDKRLQITVADDGRGLPDKSQLPQPDGLPSAFSLAGSQTEAEADMAASTSIFAAANLHSGLGIGLQIVENQVERLGGAFELRSVPGKGTTATLLLPYAGSEMVDEEGSPDDETDCYRG